MNLTSMGGLLERLTRGRQARAKFVSSQVDKFIAFQIRALRDRENMSQAELAAALDTSQAAVHRFESPNKGRPTITTLKKIAGVFDVGLEVRFVPFGKMMKSVTGTPHVEHGLSTEAFYVPSFEMEFEPRDVGRDEIAEASENPLGNIGKPASSIGTEGAPLQRASGGL